MTTDSEVPSLEALPEIVAPSAPAPRTGWLSSIGQDDAALFDVPGPRGRRRIAIATVVSTVAIAGLFALALRQFAINGQLEWSKWELFTQWPVIRYLLTALWATVQVTLVTGALAVPLGAVLALARLSRSPLLSKPATLYVEVLRAIPLLLLIYAFLLGLPSTGIRIPLFWQLVIPITLTNAAVLAEIFRAGVRALPKGQSEAAFALGLGYWPTMRLVVLPQAVRLSAPALISQIIRLLKDSTLGYVVSYLELLASARVLGEFNHTVLQSFVVVAAVFIVLNLALAALAAQLERRIGGSAGRH
ncbi:amino acid ABC transporter permease [Kineosporia sp. J2-2]|uniref:Amino acid ABC transporter permease n=1 Tax=Kineosporia corallincola TaxID=2835133 RepID=A0ABS5TQ42_9ACTN|nr:amino acid ABC transporter permease [Kineosporia corallincola]MBT0772301.1 amino acid ABC transporter permease [Kineosporia corallincola]